MRQGQDCEAPQARLLMVFRRCCHYDERHLAHPFRTFQRVTQTMRARSVAVRVACWLFAALAAAAHAQVARVQVDEFVVTGNTLLPPETLYAALARFKGER